AFFSVSAALVRDMATGQTSGDVGAVRLRLPQFWPSDPLLWFAQVRDLILKPPNQNPYDTLKTKLVRRTSIYEQRRLQQLQTTEELGDKTPSQMLRRLQQLLGDSSTTIDPSLLRELYLQRLPATFRMVLAPTTNITIEALAQLADRVVAVASPAISTVATDSLAVRRSPQENSDTRKPLVLDGIEDMRMQINQLTTQVAALMTAAPFRSRQRSRSLKWCLPPSYGHGRNAGEKELRESIVGAERQEEKKRSARSGSARHSTERAARPTISPPVDAALLAVPPFAPHSKKKWRKKVATARLRPFY
ncbi:hypothetical protein HPB47_003659, partial [Ixodes persulcatus]